MAAVVTWGGTTLVDSAVGVYHGEARVTIGDVTEETSEWSVPRCNGVGERTSGLRSREFRVDVTYYSTVLATLLTTLDAQRRLGQYQTLVAPNVSASWCRLSRIDYDEKQAGYNSAGAVMVMRCSLYFKQVQV